MNKGVEIIMRRMDSHPEEFDRLKLQLPNARPDQTRMKWAYLVDVLLDAERSGGFFSAEERETLIQKLAQVQAAVFTKHVLHVLTTTDDSTTAKGGST
jgi:hypothetical protein